MPAPYPAHYRNITVPILVHDPDLQDYIETITDHAYGPVANIYHANTGEHLVTIDAARN